MTTFKVGDRVRSAKLADMRGVVEAVKPVPQGCKGWVVAQVVVRYPDGGRSGWVPVNGLVRA